jgi:tripartite-type tricarboxylate transporter receptor subunit TctC
LPDHSSCSHPLRRICLQAAFALSALAALPAPAQGFPAKPIRIVVPAGAGGPADILGRLLGQRLSLSLGQPVLIENKPGASLMLGADIVAKAAPDGYTLLLTADGAITINPGLFPKMSYDPQKDLVPVAKVVTLPLVLVVNPAVPAKDTAELIALAKAQPGKLNFGAGGGTSRMAAELFRISTGTDMVHVPYKGSGPMVNGLLGNEVQLAFDGVPSSMAQVKGGRLRALAVTGATRLPALPNLPTVAEAGVPGYEAGTWIGLFAPAGLPREVQARLYTEIGKVMQQPDMAERLGELGMTPDLAPPESFAPQIAKDMAKWSQLIKRAGITADN